ncbi:TPA: translation initiation factor IF-2 [Candidatus Poribacteria bacterium]|nr:translation initiation factor IF-2 [Candidatus Poribacteria bacterium]
MSNKELLKKLNKYGVEVKSHMSSIDDETLELIMAEFGEQEPEPEPQLETKTLKVEEGITVSALSNLLNVKKADLIKVLMQAGIMANINQRLDLNALTILSKKYEFEPIKKLTTEERLLAGEPDSPENLRPRPPVVTIMGHVNHGKTSLLDAVRETNVMEREAGGITQHIGAYRVSLENGDVVFLDTPGHEAFTKMRARGAQVTDIVVLVVAADDGVMPQTIEAINHAKAANVPIVVAVNKIDKENAKPERVRQQLSEYGLVPEEWGGKNIFVNISAKSKIGIEDLLESILLEAELLELKANPNKLARGTVIEAQMSKSRGPVVNVLVQDGTLKVGDYFVAGMYDGKVRAMVDDKGKNLQEALPSTPVEVLGCSGVPEAGDKFYAVNDEKEAKAISESRRSMSLERDRSAMGRKSLDIYQLIKDGKVKDLNIILKGDVQGSIEALSESLLRLNNDEVKINIIHSAVGSITENDVMLASASDAIVIGFNVRPTAHAAKLAEREHVDIRLYNVIYQAISEVRTIMEGLLEPELREVILGRAQILEVFNISRVGTIAGCQVINGRVVRNQPVRVLRNNRSIFEGKIDSLKIFSEDVREVASGQECGILVNGFSDFQRGDILECYTFEQVPVKLGS